MKLTPPSNSYRQAKRKADVAREDFRHSVETARDRLAPRRLKADAALKLRQTVFAARHAATAKARAHPFLLMGLLSGIVGFIFRGPVMALCRTAGVSLNKTVQKAWQARKHSGDD
ncbi:hypothetical protein [Rhizorhapis sp. SPR117]|uniref:hypothetical protein n=1 Tax=Rhizorhapis sp. SPR117 TaxID=2912611 RepID=UPI001F367379|nr:hypothetical protein [Rhizorhapis sp. SPR117]